MLVLELALDLAHVLQGTNRWPGEAGGTSICPQDVAIRKGGGLALVLVPSLVLALILVLALDLVSFCDVLCQTVVVAVVGAGFVVVVAAADNVVVAAAAVVAADDDTVVAVVVVADDTVVAVGVVVVESSIVPSVQSQLSPPSSPSPLVAHCLAEKVLVTHMHAVVQPFVVTDFAVIFDRFAIHPTPPSEYDGTVGTVLVGGK